MPHFFSSTHFLSILPCSFSMSKPITHVYTTSLKHALYFSDYNRIEERRMRIEALREIDQLSTFLPPEGGRVPTVAQTYRVHKLQLSTTSRAGSSLSCENCFQPNHTRTVSNILRAFVPIVVSNSFLPYRVRAHSCKHPFLIPVIRENTSNVWLCKTSTSLTNSATCCSPPNRALSKQTSICKLEFLTLWRWETVYVNP